MSIWIAQLTSVPAPPVFPQRKLGQLLGGRVRLAVVNRVRAALRSQRHFLFFFKLTAFSPFFKLLVHRLIARLDTLSQPRQSFDAVEPCNTITIYYRVPQFPSSRAQTSDQTRCSSLHGDFFPNRCKMQLKHRFQKRRPRSSSLWSWRARSSDFWPTLHDYTVKISACFALVSRVLGSTPILLLERKCRTRLAS